jgi:hypothetical protein
MLPGGRWLPGIARLGLCTGYPIPVSSVQLVKCSALSIRAPVLRGVGLGCRLGAIQASYGPILQSQSHNLRELVPAILIH